VSISDCIKPPTSTKNILDYLFARAVISRAPFHPHPSMTTMEDCEFGRLEQAPSSSWFVGLVKKECRTYWTITLNRLTLPAGEVCSKSLWGGCPICPRPVFKINDLTERNLNKTWTPESICIHDIVRNDIGYI
jgi:hypothetical protein